MGSRSLHPDKTETVHGVQILSLHVVFIKKSGLPCAYLITFTGFLIAFASGDFFDPLEISISGHRNITKSTG